MTEIPRGEPNQSGAARSDMGRIRRLLHVLPSLDIGGIQTRLIDIVNRLPPDYEHVFIALDGRQEALSRVQTHVAYRAEPAPSRNLPLPRRLQAYARAIAERRPDILLTYNWGAIEFALANAWTRVAHIHAEDGFGPDEAKRQLPRRIWTRRIALRRSLVVVPSHTLEQLARRTWRIAPQRLRRIPNGIDLEKFAPRSGLEARTALGLPQDAFVVGWVGALRPEKNVERLLRAFAYLPPHSRLVIVGDGPLRERLQRIATELGVAARIHWLGLRRDVAEILAAFDVLALSSDTEQMPIVVMEAMAAGLPIASVDVGDVRAMVSPANRQLVTTGTDEALGRTLGTLIEDAQLRVTIGAANRSVAIETFGLRSMVDTYDALYRSATA